MSEGDILTIVRKAFDSNIENWLDLGESIHGKEFFFDEVKENIKKLFDENDLSK